MQDTLDTNSLAAKVQDLLGQGAKVDVVRQALGKKYDVDTVNSTLLQALEPKIAKLRQDGVGEELIMKVLQDKGVVPSTPLASPAEHLGSVEPQAPTEPPTEVTMVQREAPVTILDPELPLPEISLDTMEPREVIEQFTNITNSQERDFKALVSKVGIPGWAQDAKRLRAQANGVMATQLKARGIDVTNIDEFGIVTALDPETGEEFTYDQPWYDDVLDSLTGTKFEIGGAITGAIGGGRAGAAVGGLWGAFGGALLGGMGGASLGSGADLINAAREVQYNIGIAELQNRMGEAATADALGALAVGSLFKIGAATAKGLANGYDRLLKGNRHGAYSALKETTNLNDKQIIALVEDWERHTGTSMLSDKARSTGKLSFEDQGNAIHVAGQSLPQLTGSVAGAIDLSKSGGAKLAQEIAARASDMQNSLASITNDNVAALADQNLSQYTKKVQDYFGDIKLIGIEEADKVNFRFTFDNITSLDESLTESANAIANYSIRANLRDNLDEIRRLGAAPVNNTESLNPNRTFSDLLALRNYVNQVSSDSRYQQFLNHATIKSAKASIDGEITRAASQMENGSAWLSQWKQANVEYTKMKALEKNVLFKALKSPKASPDKVVRAFAESLNYNGPESFMQVMGKLPPTSRRAVEGAVLKHYVTKNTSSLGESMEAINFPHLAKQLESLALTTPEARALKRTVTEMAQVFKNDRVLAKVAWDSPAGRFKGNLSTTVRGKIKMQLASYLFQLWQAVVPTRGSDRLALTLQMRKVLDNPLNAKAIKELKANLPRDAELDSVLHSYALEYAKFGTKEKYGETTLYRVASPGKKNKAGETQLGRGILYYLDKVEANKVAKATGATVSEQTSLNRLIAQPKDVEKVVQRLYNRPATKEDYRNLEVTDALRANFEGVTVGAKAILFK